MLFIFLELFKSVFYKIQTLKTGIENKFLFNAEKKVIYNLN